MMIGGLLWISLDADFEGGQAEISLDGWVGRYWVVRKLEADLANELYFEDLQVGRRFNSQRSYKVTAEEIKEFAERYDPQPFHLDEAAGESSFFKGLAASGWLTAAIVMRLRVESIAIAGGMIGAGVDEMRWTQAVRPGDSLRTEAEILEVRRSGSRPEYGIVKSRTTVFNQRDEVVMRSVVNFLAPLKNRD